MFKNRDIRLQIDHIDGNKQNNHYTNLEWVTSAENTRRAHATGLYNTRGENSSTNIYPETLIHDICKMFVNGMNNMAVFRKVMNKVRIDYNSKEDMSMYTLIHRLRHKKIWIDVVSQYEYETSSNSEKEYLPKDKNSKFSLDQIHQICKLHVDGKTTDEIYDILGLNKIVINDPKEELRYKNVIRNIKSGNIWSQISKEYFKPEKRAHTVRNIDENVLSRMISSNIPRNEIYKYFGIKNDGTKEDSLLRRSINKRILKINKMKAIKENESILLNENEIKEIIV